MLIWTGDMGTRFASHVCVQAKEVGGAAMRSPFKLHTHNMCCGKCYADEPLELGDCYCHLVDDAGWCWCRYVQVLRHGPTTVRRNALCVLLPGSSVTDTPYTNRHTRMAKSTVTQVSFRAAVGWVPDGAAGAGRAAGAGSGSGSSDATSVHSDDSRPAGTSTSGADTTTCHVNASLVALTHTHMLHSQDRHGRQPTIRPTCVPSGVPCGSLGGQPRCKPAGMPSRPQHRC